MTDRPFSIGIDGLNLAMSRGTGVATYARTLGRAVNAMGGSVDLVFGVPIHPQSRPDVRETLFFAELGRDDASDDRVVPVGPVQRLRRLVVSPLPRRLVPVPVTGRVRPEGFADRLPPFARLHSFGGLWNVAARHFRRYGRFLDVTMTDPPSVMHWTYPVPVRLVGAANIYTIHDLVPLRLPHTSLEDKRYHDRLLRRCVAQGAAICTVSEASRADIIELLGASPERVINCYQSIDPVTLVPDADMATRLRALFDLEPREYFLYFGAIEPKKNVGRLIEAYLCSGVEAPLVIVGGRSWRSEDELRLLGAPDGRPLPGVARIRKLDYLPRRLLDLLVAGARAVVFPSLSEGFGLPAVEAMARGVPTIVSTAGSLPEVVGSAALQVDPYDVAALTDAIQRVDRDRDLRRTLATAGPVQAAHFSPEAFQAKLHHLYRPLLRLDGLAQTEPGFVAQKELA